MAEEDNGDCKQDEPVVDFGKSLPHETEVHLAAGQIQENQTDDATDDQPSGVASQFHASVILIPLPIFLHRAYSMAGFAGLIAGFDVKIDLCTLRKKLPNVVFEMFGDRVSL
jgi:hypothetical protein